MSSNNNGSSSPSAVVNDGGGESSWLTRLFNMDGSMDSTEIAFLWLVIFGVLVLFAFVVYILCRIFCYDYWASCLSKCRTKGPFATVKRTDSTTMLHNGNRGESSESGDIVRQIVLHGGNNKNMSNRDKPTRNTKTAEKWQSAARRASVFSTDGFVPDEILYRANNRIGNGDGSNGHVNNQGMILYPHYPAAGGGGGGGDLRKRSSERQQVLQAVYDFAWNSEGSDVKYRDSRRGDRAYEMNDVKNHDLRRYNNHDDDYSPPNVKNGGLASHDLRNVVDLPGAAAEEVKERRRPRPKRMDNEEASKGTHNNPRRRHSHDEQRKDDQHRNRRHHRDRDEDGEDRQRRQQQRRRRHRSHEGERDDRGDNRRDKHRDGNKDWHDERADRDRKRRRGDHDEDSERRRHRRGDHEGNNGRDRDRHRDRSRRRDKY